MPRRRMHDKGAEGFLELLQHPVLRAAGMVKRVRGIAYSMRVAPAASNRMVDGARGVLNAMLADVFVFTDHMPGHEAGDSPGYGLSLVGETTTGLLISSQASAPPAVKVVTIPSLLASLHSVTLRSPLTPLTSLVRLASVGPAYCRSSHVQGEKSQLVPEDIGKQAAYMLLEEVQRGGICDSMHQVSGTFYLGSGRLIIWSQDAVTCDLII